MRIRQNHSTPSDSGIRYSTRPATPKSWTFFVRRTSPPNSYERLFHETGTPRFLLAIRDDQALADALTSPRLERAIGVVYKPETERGSHYFHARLAQQFDYVLHFDETTALDPLERTAVWTAGEPAETYPSGL